MKTIIKKLTIRIFLLILVSNISIAQQKNINPGEKPVTLNMGVPPEKSITPQREISAVEEKLTEQLMQAKQKGSEEEMIRIQKTLDTYAGSVTKQEISAGKTEPMSGSLPPGQNITSTKILEGQNVKAVTIQREQIGSSNRMWAIIAQSQNQVQADTIYTLFSDDNGNNWTYFSRSYFTNRFIMTDDIDAEIIQTATQKYMYIVCGMRSFSNGKFHTGLIVNAIAGATGGSVFHLNWPGEDQTNVNVLKYRTRITSDCANHQFSGAWIFIVCSQDSAVSGGYQTTEKTARINNPYTVFPAVTYKSGPFYWSTFSPAYLSNHCDLAYYRDGSSESIMVTESNIPIESYVYMLKSTIQNFTSSATYSGSLDGGTSLRKSYGRISSNGNYTNLMIINNEEYSSVDRDIQYFKTTNSGANWTTGYVDYTTDLTLYPDIIERKNVPGEFYAAYTNDLGFGVVDVSFCKAVGSVWGAVVPRMSYMNVDSYRVPRPCFLTTGVDNCFAIWVQSNPKNTWVSSGCTGSLVLNKNLRLYLYIQGRYNQLTNNMVGDTVRIELRNNFSPYSLVGSAKSYLSSFGFGSFNFSAAVNGTNYYIVVKHRNSIETWSRSPGQSFSSDILNYDFTGSGSQAYGNNQALVSITYYRFGIYTGDVNQDGTVDLTDMSFIDNDANNFVSGYVKTDLTGDNYVDLSDYAIADNNAFNFVSKIRP